MKRIILALVALSLFNSIAPGKPVPPRIRLFADYLAKAFGRIQQGDRDGS